MSSSSIIGEWAHWIPASIIEALDAHWVIDESAVDAIGILIFVWL
jgi:hypothetical protein